MSGKCASLGRQASQPGSVTNITPERGASKIYTKSTQVQGLPRPSGPPDIHTHQERKVGGDVCRQKDRTI